MKWTDWFFPLHDDYTKMTNALSDAADALEMGTKYIREQNEVIESQIKMIEQLVQNIEQLTETCNNYKAMILELKPDAFSQLPVNKLTIN